MNTRAIAWVSSFAAILISLTLRIPTYAQKAEPLPTTSAPLEQHYDAAQGYQSAGNLIQAALHYRLFLADGLAALGNYRAEAGESERASSLFEEALRLAPEESLVKLDYAAACLAATDFRKARLFAESVVDSEPKNATARRLLGQALIRMDEREEGKRQLEMAVSLEPDFANGYALAGAYLKLRDEDSATRIFSEMLRSFGDKPDRHLQFGTAYADAGYQEKAIAELKKAIAENTKLPGAHYLLAAVYLSGRGSGPDYDDATVEFQREIDISPADYNSHLALGVIALSQHNLQEAEGELSRAAALDSQNPDPWIRLGQLYDQAGRATEAEAAWRKAISLTPPTSRNPYEAARVHYFLARSLLQAGRLNEAAKEMEVSNRLLDQSLIAKSGQSIGVPENGVATEVASSAAEYPQRNAEALKQLASLEERIGPAIADSYNNLGVIAASGNDFVAAVVDFQKAADWNPSLDGLDYNWGRAAFSGHQYEQAVGPLQRYLANHSEDAGARSTLALCFFLLQRYQEALKTFQALEEVRIDAVPVLAFGYAVSLVKAGDYNVGLQRLQALEKANSDDPNIHKALGEAFASHGNYSQAAEELRTALRQNPGDKDAEREFNSYQAARQQGKQGPSNPD